MIASSVRAPLIRDAIAFQPTQNEPPVNRGVLPNLFAGLTLPIIFPAQPTVGTITTQPVASAPITGVEAPPAPSTPVTSTPAPVDPAQQTIDTLLSGSGDVPGSGSIAADAPVPVTDTTSGPDTTVVLLVIVAAVGVLIWYLWHRHKAKAKAAE